MKKTSYFITGTDTGVGKTAGTSALAAAWQAAGEKITVMKPIQTGATQRSDATWLAPDLDYALHILQQTQTSPNHAPICYEPPCSPHLAAKTAKRPIDIKAILDAYTTLSQTHERILVEGAGGLMVPLNEDWDMIDLIRALKLPCLLAIRPNLGTLNHTQLTADALAQANIPFAGWFSVSTTPEPWSFIEHDNIATLIQRLDAPYLGNIPYIQGAENPQRARDPLTQAGTQLIHAL